MTQNTQISFQPNLYVNGLIVSNDATTPNTVLDIAAGACRDINNNMDMVLSATTLNAAVNGANGLDTGSLAASKDYFVMVIGSSQNNQQPATLLSLSATAPTLPAGYDSWRVIAYVKTDGSSHFTLFTIVGSDNARTLYWDTAVSVLSAGHATSLTAIDLTTAVPASLPVTPALIIAEFTPATAGHSVGFTPFGSTATTIPVLFGSVASQPNSAQFKIIAKSDASTPAKPTILYIGSNSSDATTVLVSGFEFYL